MRWNLCFALAALPLIAASPPPLKSVIDAKVDISAAERFAALWRATGGKPSATQIQKAYLDNGGRGIEIFTRGRIESAEHLAGTVAANPAIYRDAVDRCLPWARQQDGAFRAVNLALRGLLPERRPPEVAIVVGANNSGGTAGQGMQVIGLEVICRISPDKAAFDERMRGFFAHEAIHTFQDIGGPRAGADWLMTQSIAEGTATYVAWLLTGVDPGPEKTAYAEKRGASIWSDFQADRAIVASSVTDERTLSEAGEAAARRWVMNAGESDPSGPPGEMGYWVGMQIAKAYVEASADPRQALEELLSFDDPGPIVARAATRIPGLRAALAR